jgi:hypothetical protein
MWKEGVAASLIVSSPESLEEKQKPPVRIGGILVTI